MVFLSGVDSCGPSKLVLSGKKNIFDHWIGAQNGITISYEWIQDTPKKGIRFDGNGDPLGVHGYAGFNVVWNHDDNREIDTKGDNHTVVNNVGWDDDESDCTVCVPNSHSGNPMNRNSIVLNNAARKMTGS